LVEAWHPVDFRRTLLDLIIDVKPARENSCLNSLYLVLIRKQLFSDERDQLSAFSNQLVPMTAGVDSYFRKRFSRQVV